MFTYVPGMLASYENQITTPVQEMSTILTLFSCANEYEEYQFSHFMVVTTLNVS